METHVKTEKTPARDLFLRTVAVLGLIAILLLGAWGIIQLAFAIPTVFSNLGGSISSLFTTTPGTNTTATKEAITVTVPTTATSGQGVQVSWMHKNADKSGQYSYALSYACQSGLTVKAPLPNGSFQPVPCNTLFNYVNASSQMTVVPTLTGSNNESFTMTVTATKLSSGLVTASGAATTNVAPTKVVTTPTAPTKPVKTTTKPATTTYYPAATRATNLYGYGDLAVTITKVAPSAGATTVKFTITNTGTNVVNSGWTFNANLPINGSYTFGSQPQQALYPGDKIAYVLTYDDGQNYNQNYNQAYQYGANGYQNGYSNYGYGYPATGYSTSGYNCSNYNCTNNNVVSNYPANNNYNYGYQNPSATVTIIVDPSNFVQELNKNNNTAQTSVATY